jgi:hypothetical protein
MAWIRGLADGRAAPERSFRGEEGNSSNGFPDMLIWFGVGVGVGFEIEVEREEYESSVVIIV